MQPRIFSRTHTHARIDPSKTREKKYARSLNRTPNSSPERDCYERARAYACPCACVRVWNVGKEFPRGSIVIAGALSRLKTSLQEQRKREALLQLSPSASGSLLPPPRPPLSSFGRRVSQEAFAPRLPPYHPLSSPSPSPSPSPLTPPPLPLLI